VWDPGESRLAVRHTFDVGSYSGYARIVMKLVTYADVWVNGWPQYGISFTGNGQCGSVFEYFPLPVHPGINTVVVAVGSSWIPGVGSFGLFDLQLSTADTVVPTRSSSWGSVKQYYR